MDANIIRKVFESGQFSDLTLVCGDDEFKVHRLVLYSQSPVFRGMLDGKYKEATLGRITLEDDPIALHALLAFMYSNYYEKYMPQDQSVMTWTVKIHAIADKYDIEKLRTVTVANLGRLLNPTTNMPDYIEAIKTVDQSTGSMHGPMWKVVLENIQTNIAYLRGKPEFKELMIDMPDLIMALIGRLDGVKKVTNGGLHRDTDDDDENQDTYLGGRGAGFGRRLG